jgi:hypothetical protein
LVKNVILAHILCALNDNLDNKSNLKLMLLMLLQRIFVNCYSSFSSDSSENEISLSSNPLWLDHTVIVLVVLEIGLSVDSSKIGML